MNDDVSVTLRELHRELGTWKSVAEHLNGVVSEAMCWKVANGVCNSPKINRQLRALGLMPKNPLRVLAFRIPREEFEDFKRVVDAGGDRTEWLRQRVNGDLYKGREQ